MGMNLEQARQGAVGVVGGISLVRFGGGSGGGNKVRKESEQRRARLLGLLANRLKVG